MSTLPRLIKHSAIERTGEVSPGLDRKDVGNSLFRVHRLRVDQVDFDDQGREAPPSASRARILSGEQTDLQEAIELPLPDFEAMSFLSTVDFSDDASVEQPAPDEGDAAELDHDTLRAEWEARWQAEHEAALRTTREEGYAAGYHEAEAALQADVDATIHTLHNAATQFSEALQDYMRQLDPLLAQFAFRIAETILDAPLAQDLKDVSGEVLSDAVERLAGDPPLDVSLHPVDFLRLQESGLVEQLEFTHNRLRWHPDSAMKQGDWIVQSPMATIRHLERDLLATLEQRLQNAPPPHQASSTDENAAPAP